MSHVPVKWCLCNSCQLHEFMFYLKGEDEEEYYDEEEYEREKKEYENEKKYGYNSEYDMRE